MRLPPSPGTDAGDKGLSALSGAVLPATLLLADKAEGERFSEPRRTRDNALRRKQGPGLSGCA
jgi:hypothetical protein